MEFCYACGGVYNNCECSKRELRGFGLPSGDEDEEEIKVDLDEALIERIRGQLLLSSLVDSMREIGELIEARENGEKLAAQKAREEAAQKAREVPARGDAERDRARRKQRNGENCYLF
jgi:hypothetical protein